MAALLNSSGEQFPRSAPATAERDVASHHGDRHRTAPVDWVRFRPDALTRQLPESDPRSQRRPVTIDGFDGWPAQLAEYLRQTPDLYDVDRDAEGFLRWLLESAEGQPGDADSDATAAVVLPTSVEYVELRQRLAHLRFQQRLERSERLLSGMTRCSRLVVTLNPIHVRAKLGPAPGVDSEDTAASEMLFFPVRDEIRTIVVGVDAGIVLERLQRRGVCRVRDLVGRIGDDSADEALELLRELCRQGVIAFG